MSTRREFLHLLGAGTLAGLPFRPLEPTTVDALTLAKGLAYRVIVSDGDPLTAKDTFGAGSDFVGFVQLDHRDDGLLWVSHTGGGSIIRVQRGSGRWVVVRDDSYNRRITADTVVPLVSERPLPPAKGIARASGGAVTPWGTVLSAEDDDGWVVELDPRTGVAKKLCGLGRYSHGGVAIRNAADGRPVVYSGCARPYGSLYKFIGDVPGSLDRGILYVANVEARRWEQLGKDVQPSLSKFKDQTDVLMRAQEAAWLAGGSRLDAPSGVAIDGATGCVLVSCLGNTERRNFTGQLVRLAENASDLLALTFEVTTILSGGLGGRPAGLALDAAGNLFVTTDEALYVMATREPPKPICIARAPNRGRLTGHSFARDGTTMFMSVQPAEGHWPFAASSPPRSSVIAVEGDLWRDLAGS